MRVIQRIATAATLGVLGLALAGNASADEMSGMKGMTMSSAPTAKRGQGTGVITALDQKAETITIRHGAIPAVGWPAMTMTFKAKPAALLNGLKIGQSIGFDCSVRGAAAEVTAVRPK